MITIFMWKLIIDEDVLNDCLLLLFGIFVNLIMTPISIILDIILFPLEIITLIIFTITKIIEKRKK